MATTRKFTTLRQVAGGFSQMIRAGSVKAEDGTKKKGLQFRLKLAIDESLGDPAARRQLAMMRLREIIAMRDAMVAEGRGAQAQKLMVLAGKVASDPEKFAIAIATAGVALARPEPEGVGRFQTWGQLAEAWVSGELGRLYPGAGYAKTSSDSTDAGRVRFFKPFIGSTKLAAFGDADYWRAMRPARAHCVADSTYMQYSQVIRRVLKIAVELQLIDKWPLGATCKLPKPPKGSEPEFPFLYPDEYERLVSFPDILFERRVLWGFIIKEGPRISEAVRIGYRHLEQMPNGRWLLRVPKTKTGRALEFVLAVGTAEMLFELRRRRPELDGPFAWVPKTLIKKGAEQLRADLETAGVDRERLLFTEGRLHRVREHDLRSTYVTGEKLRGVDNETIAAHTGHESSKMIARYNRSKVTLEHMGLPPYKPLVEAMALPAPRRALGGGGVTGGCDTADSASVGQFRSGGESSMFSAVREEGLEPSHPFGAPEPKSAAALTGARRKPKSAAPGTPEEAGTSGPSHPRMTPAEAYAQALLAAERLAADARAPLEDIAHLRRMYDIALKATVAPVLDLLSARRAKS